MADYSFGVAADTLNGKVIENKLADEIQASSISSAALLAVGVSGATTERDSDGALSDGTITCTFDATLSAGDETTLGNVVSSHAGQLTELEKESRARIWYADAESAQMVSGTAFSDMLTLNVTVPAGIYELSWYAELGTLDSVDAYAEARVTANGNEQAILHAGFTKTSTPERMFAGMKGASVNQGSFELKMQLRRVGGTTGDQVSIRRARLMVKKIREL